MISDGMPRGWGRWLAALALLAAIPAPLRAQGTDWAARARATADFMDRQWGRDAGWNQSEAWQRFVIVDAMLDYERRTGDDRWSGRTAAAVRNRSGLYLNDDALWAVIASTNAWTRDHDPALLEYATATYERIVRTYWDDRCGGGLWWDPARTYKNAITNELLLHASTRLFEATGQDAYRQWALRTWAWIAGSSMIGADGLVNDGLDARCHNNGQPTFTYNQGVVIGGLTDLARITGDPAYRALAVRTALAATRGLSTEAGVLREPVPSIGADGFSFKGVFAYHLGHLLDAMPDGADRRELAHWAQANADSVWAISAAASRPIGSDWTNGDSPSGAAAQASGLAMLLAAGSPAPDVPVAAAPATRRR